MEPDDADRRVLEFLAAQRAAVESQLRVWLKASQRAHETRLRQLERAGLLRRQRLFAEQPALIWITRPGAAALGISLRAGKPRQRELRHDIGVGWLWIAARGGAFGDPQRLISERQIRSHDARLDRGELGEPLGVGLGGFGPAGQPARHIPDLLLDLRDGRRVALELELTRKSREALDGVMLTYATDRRIDKVLYLVPDAALGRAVSQAAERAGIARLIQVERVAADGIEGGPRVGASTATRRPARRPEVSR